MEAAYKNMHEKEGSQDGLTLPKDFKWFKPGLGFTCKAKDIGLDSYVECLETNSCPFSVRFGYGYYCKCPARVRAAKEI